MRLWLLTLPRLQSALELSCDGYRYNGIDWESVRSTLEIYADKYLDRPQLLAEVFDLASQYGLEYHPGNACTLGDLSMRFLLWLRLEEQELRHAVASLTMQPPQTSVEQLIQETYEWFWDINFTWAEIMKSGWPLFSIIASVAGRLVDSTQDPCIPAEKLAPYTESFDNAIYVPAHVDIATLLEASQCPDAVASAMVSMADNHRTADRGSANRYYQFTSLRLEHQPPETDVNTLLAKVEEILRRDRSWRLLTTQWPLWRLLDRLSAEEIVNVTSGTASFRMHVFPHRVRSDGIISNRIRGTRRAYCLQLFQDEVLRLAASSTKALRLVEAGPHIGDCMLWASAMLRDRVRCLAVEPVSQVVALFQKSIAANDFNIKLRHAWLGAKVQEPGEGESLGWLTLDSLLAEDIDVLKIHTNGGERDILEGAKFLFSEHKVHVVIVHSAEPDELWSSAVFLIERGYRTVTEGRRLSLTDESWLKNMVESRGGLQIHAVVA